MSQKEEGKVVFLNSCEGKKHTLLHDRQLHVYFSVAFPLLQSNSH